MKTLFLDGKLDYDGSQLRPLFAYEDHGVLGNSCIAFRGACDISFAQMKDLEDLRDQSAIRGADMVHFILEIFDPSLWGAVAFQRLTAAIIQQGVLDLSAGKIQLRRQGDDLFWNEKKFSISIASKSAVSVMIHFAVNVSNQNTPVPTCALEDFKIPAEVFARTMLAHLAFEFQSTIEATQKVRPL